MSLALVAVAGCAHKSVDDYLGAGDQAMQKAQLSTAEQNYQAAESLAPNDPRVHVALGNLYVFEQKPDSAQVEFMKVLELDPGNAAAHSALGQLYQSESQLGPAEEQFRAAVALTPADPDYRVALGRLLQKAGKTDRAESEMRTAIGLAPRDARYHLALAYLLNSMPGRQAEAQSEIAEVQALDPHLIPAAAATPAAAPTPAVATTPIRPLNRKFLLTQNSPVHETADQTSPILAKVHRGRWVHVTGIQGRWFQVTLRNGTVGFIPTSAAE